MICIAIVIALFALFAVKRRVWRHAYAHGCHHRGWHHHHGHHHGPPSWGGPGRGRPGRRGVVDFISDRLDLTPAQEKVVIAEIDKLSDQLHGLRDERGKTHADLARAVRGDALDEVAFGEMFARHDERLEQLRGDVMGALGRIHAVLEPAQRERLADLLESGRGHGWGPYRV